MNEQSRPSEKRTTVRSHHRGYRPQSATPLAWVSRLSPALGGLLGAHWFTQPRRHRRPERERPILERATTITLPPNLAAWQWGNGPTVLLVHGWEGRGSQLGAFVEPLVEAGYRVIALDAKAHGDSPGGHATLRDFVRAIEAAERFAGSLHAVIAHSFGCPAVSWAIKRGLRVNAVSFVAPPSTLEAAPAYFGKITGMNEEAVAAMKARVMRVVGTTFEELRLENFGPQMKAPLYIAHDRDDTDVPFHNAQRYLEHWPGASLRASRGLGHRRILGDAAVIRDVVDFIDSVALDDRESELGAWFGQQLAGLGRRNATVAATTPPGSMVFSETEVNAPLYPTI